MRVAIISILVLMLGASVVSLVYITRIEKVYAKVWGTDISMKAWQRKKWAFVFMVIAQFFGAVSVFFPHRNWYGLVYLLFMLAFVSGYCDSYRILLADLKKLPKKR